MLPKGHRLVDRNRIAEIARNGRSAVDGPLLLKWLREGAAQKPPRVAFVASKKHFSKAVERNRVKRLTREALRPSLERILPDYDILVMYRFRPESLEIRQIEAGLVRILEKHKLLKG